MANDFPKGGISASDFADYRLKIIAEAKADLIKSTNIEGCPEEMAVIDNILFRCYQMGWLDKYCRTSFDEETKTHEFHIDPKALFDITSKMSRRNKK